MANQMNASTTIPFEVGDKIPYATLLQMIGTPFVLFYFLKEGHLISDQLLTEFNKTADAFKTLGVKLVGLSPIARPLESPFPLMVDEGLGIGRQLGVAHSDILGSIERVEAQPTIFLVDGTLRVRQIIHSVHPQAEIAQLLQDIPEKLFYQETAPVLKVPFTFDQILCQNLLKQWMCKEKETEEGALERSVDLCIAKRVLPCLRAAFRYTPVYREPPQIIQQSTLPLDRLLKANALPTTHTREFALIIPLKMEVLEGHELIFLEYGPTQYHVNVGEALVFSCDLLHQYLSSKQGEIYWFMTFFHTEQPTLMPNKSSHISDALF